MVDGVVGIGTLEVVGCWGGAGTKCTCMIVYGLSFNHAT